MFDDEIIYLSSILIADDCPIMRRMLKTILQTEGYEVVAEAKDGNEAVRLFEKTSPDIVIMDINMPHMDGLTATLKIKDIDPDVTIIMITGEQDEEKIREAIKNGVSEYILKPVQHDRLLAVVQKYSEPD